MPPRSLKAPLGVWFSFFTPISTPVSALSQSQAYWGVGGTIARSSRITLSSSASVNIRLYVRLQLTNDLTLAPNALLSLSDTAEICPNGQLVIRLVTFMREMLSPARWLQMNE